MTNDEALNVLSTLPKYIGNYPEDEVGNYRLALMWDEGQWTYGYFLRNTTYILEKSPSLAIAVEELAKQAAYLRAHPEKLPGSTAIPYRILNGGKIEHKS